MTKVVKRSLLFVMTVVLALCAFMTVGAMSAKADGTVITPIGASIRLNEGSTGIRFEASISQEVEGAVYGFIIVPDYYLDGIDGDYGPELSQKYSGNIIVLQSTPVDGVIKGSVANIKPQNYGLTYAGIPFEGFPETDNFIYGEIMYASVLDVASAAKIDTEANYEVEELAVIDDFYAKGIVAEGKEDYVASFDFAGYVANAFDFATASPATGFGQYPESGIVTDYNGTENVAKYYFYTGSENGNGIHTSCIIKIKLPQAYGADGYTIRYALVYEEAFAGANFIFKSESAGTSLSDIYVNKLPVSGEWTEQYVNTNGATDDEIYIHFHKGLTAGRVFTLYIDWVKDGDVNGVNEVELEDGYIAQYDSEAYENYAVSIPTRDDAATLGGQSVSKELVASYTDASDVTETNLLKVTVNGGDQNGIHTSVIFKVDLPKAHTTAGYTIRWAMNCTSLSGADASAFIAGGGTVRFITDEYVSNTNAWLNKFVVMNSDVYTQNTWATTYVGTLGTESNSLYIMIHRGAVQFGTFEFYISWVKEGNQLPNPKEELAKNLQPGYVAQFDDPYYAELVSVSGAECNVEMTTFDDADVLKADITAAAGAWGRLTIELPKTLTLGGAYKVRYQLVSNGGALPNYFRINNVLGALAGDREITPSHPDGVWQELLLTNLPTGSSTEATFDKDPDSYNFQFINTSAEASFTLYVDYIYDITAANQQLVESLPEGYYAQFNNDAYLDGVQIGTLYGSANQGTASIVEFDGVKALKVSIDATGWSSFKITLPKALTAGANYTIKFYVDGHDGVRNANYFRFNTDINGAKDLEYGGTFTNYVGKWTEQALTVGAHVTDFNSITFAFVQPDGFEYGFDMYIAAIYATQA